MPRPLRSSPSGELTLLSSDSIENRSTVEDSGATLSTALDRLQTQVHVLERGLIQDDFKGGRIGALSTPSQNAGIGERNWVYATSGGTGSVSRSNTTGGLITPYTLLQNAGSSIGGLGLGPEDATSLGFPLSRVQWVEFRWLPNSALSISGACRIGLGQLLVTSLFGSQALLFELDRGTSTNLRLRTRVDGATRTVTTTTAANNISATVRLEHTDERTWSFSMNGAVLGTFSGNDSPSESSLVGPMLQVAPNVGSGIAAQIDRFLISLT